MSRWLGTSRSTPRASVLFEWRVGWSRNRTSALLKVLAQDRSAVWCSRSHAEVVQSVEHHVLVMRH